MESFWIPMLKFKINVGNSLGQCNRLSGNYKTRQTLLTKQGARVETETLVFLLL